MIVGFMGKGGSGKSTIASRFVTYLTDQGEKVLAIDADHNMDLLFNLGIKELSNYLGSSIEELYNYIGLKSTEDYKDTFRKGLQPDFSLSKPDDFTKKFSLQVTTNLSAMASGPHTDSVLYGRNCSHSLGTPLKVYLPFLDAGDHYVIVDEKAGSDGAGTGIPTGINLAIVVVEPTPQGIKAGGQIARLLDFFGTPYEFLLNKVRNDQEVEYANQNLAKPASLVMKYDPNLPYALQLPMNATQATLANLRTKVDRQKNEPDLRLKKTKEKFARNFKFETDQP